MDFVTIILALLLFSFLIFAHEFGHYLAAKLSGVQVNEFSVFMGPALVKWRRGETQYAIRCIPFGGFCEMEGEDSQTDNPRSFLRAAWWKRLIILVAGAGMNLIMGFLLMVIFFSPRTTIVQPVISYAEQGCTVVREDALHEGDRFLEVNGERVYVSSDFSMLTSLGGSTCDIVVERNGQRVEIQDLELETHLFTDPQTGLTSERLGFILLEEETNLWRLLEHSLLQTVNVVRNVRLSLQMLISGQAGLQNLTGPVGLVSSMAQTAQQTETFGAALLVLIFYGAFLSVNLAVMNMLPIPALDGGRVVALLVTTVIEKITGKKVNPKYEGYIHGAFMILLLGLMAVILFKDIFTIVKG